MCLANSRQATTFIIRQFTSSIGYEQLFIHLMFYSHWLTNQACA
jgi:hypothetical protein